jgi:predicted TIM-barrel fold metal-dependent hydrolase
VTTDVAGDTTQELWAYDADNHLREDIDAFPKYMDPAFRERGWRIEKASGKDVLWVGDESWPDWTWDTATRPGSFRENLLRMRNGENIDPFRGDQEVVRLEYRDRDARLKLMDEQKIQAELIFNTLAVSRGWMVGGDPVQTFANLRAVNRYLAAEWGWAYQDRIYAAALLGLDDLDLAVAELDRLLAQGVRAINLVPGPVGRLSPADPYFDPFWARVNEANVLVCFHTDTASHVAYREMFGGWWEPAEAAAHRGVSDTDSAFMSFQMFNERPIMDTVVALILHNLFGRFPNVKVLSVENGSFWVPYTVKLLNKHYAINQNGFWLGGKPERPSEVFKRHVFVTPFHEENVQSIVDVVGPDCVLFGSDFPHAEGLADPVTDYLSDLEVTDPVAIQKIMRDNLKNLLENSG